ncbi:MAG: hypothetical protein OES47_02800 [Acidobacteriota bacterium]|nr:hypothetical protein [Acidobacteriota bacterium]
MPLLFGAALVAFWPHWQSVSVAAGLAVVAGANFVVAAFLFSGKAPSAAASIWKKCAQVLNVLLAAVGLAALLGSLDLWILSSQELAASLALLLPPVASWLVIRRVWPTT